MEISEYLAEALHASGLSPLSLSHLTINPFALSSPSADDPQHASVAAEAAETTNPTAAKAAEAKAAEAKAAEAETGDAEAAEAEAAAAAGKMEEAEGATLCPADEKVRGGSNSVGGTDSSIEEHISLSAAVFGFGCFKLPSTPPSGGVAADAVVTGTETVLYGSTTTSEDKDSNNTTGIAALRRAAAIEGKSADRQAAAYYFNGLPPPTALDCLYCCCCCSLILRGTQQRGGMMQQMQCRKRPSHMAYRSSDSSTSDSSSASSSNTSMSDSSTCDNRNHSHWDGGEEDEKGNSSNCCCSNRHRNRSRNSKTSHIRGRYNSNSTRSHTGGSHNSNINSNNSCSSGRYSSNSSHNSNGRYSTHSNTNNRSCGRYKSSSISSSRQDSRDSHIGCACKCSYPQTGEVWFFAACSPNSSEIVCSCWSSKRKRGWGWKSTKKHLPQRNNRYYSNNTSLHLSLPPWRDNTSSSGISDSNDRSGTSSSSIRKKHNSEKNCCSNSTRSSVSERDKEIDTTMITTPFGEMPSSCCCCCETRAQTAAAALLLLSSSYGRGTYSSNSNSSFNQDNASSFSATYPGRAARGAGGRGRGSAASVLVAGKAGRRGEGGQQRVTAAKKAPPSQEGTDEEEAVGVIVAAAAKDKQAAMGIGGKNVGAYNERNSNCAAVSAEAADAAGLKMKDRREKTPEAVVPPTLLDRKMNGRRRRSGASVLQRMKSSLVTMHIPHRRHRRLAASPSKAHADPAGLGSQGGWCSSGSNDPHRNNSRRTSSNRNNNRCRGNNKRRSNSSSTTTGREYNNSSKSTLQTSSNRSSRSGKSSRSSSSRGSSSNEEAGQETSKEEETLAQQFAGPYWPSAECCCCCERVEQRRWRIRLSQKNEKKQQHHHRLHSASSTVYDEQNGSHSVEAAVDAVVSMLWLDITQNSHPHLLVAFRSSAHRTGLNMRSRLFAAAYDNEFVYQSSSAVRANSPAATSCQIALWSASEGYALHDQPAVLKDRGQQQHQHLDEDYWERQSYLSPHKWKTLDEQQPRAHSQADPSLLLHVRDTLLHLSGRGRTFDVVVLPACAIRGAPALLQMYETKEGDDCSLIVPVLCQQHRSYTPSSSSAGRPWGRTPPPSHEYTSSSAAEGVFYETSAAVVSSSCSFSSFSPHSIRGGPALQCGVRTPGHSAGVSYSLVTSATAEAAAAAAADFADAAVADAFLRGLRRRRGCFNSSNENSIDSSSGGGTYSSNSNYRRVVGRSLPSHVSEEQGALHFGRLPSAAVAAAEKVNTKLPHIGWGGGAVEATVSSSSSSSSSSSTTTTRRGLWPPNDDGAAIAAENFLHIEGVILAAGEHPVMSMHPFKAFDLEGDIAAHEKLQSLDSTGTKNEQASAGHTLSAASWSGIAGGGHHHSVFRGTNPPSSMRRSISTRETGSGGSLLLDAAAAIVSLGSYLTGSTKDTGMISKTSLHGQDKEEPQKPLHVDNQSRRQHGLLRGSTRRSRSSNRRSEKDGTISIRKTGKYMRARKRSPPTIAVVIIVQLCGDPS